MAGSRLRAAAKQLGDTFRNSGLLWTASLVADRVLPGSVLGLWPDEPVAPKLLGAQLDTILRAWGMSGEHAAITVDLILYADLRGIDSHGSSMLPHYHLGVREGWLSVDPEIATVREGGTTALIDGGGGVGHVAAKTAMDLAIVKCREHGLGAVAVRNSGHFGAAGAYASMAEAEGLIGIATTSTRLPAVVPTFGVEAKLGTNPIAFAAPAGRNPPFLLDMATSTASLGALTVAWRRGRAIPRGWALDARGGAVTNARRGYLSRRLTPLGSSREMGGHKGYGLATAMEVLSSVLPGAQTGIGHFLLAIDPGRFREEGSFESDLDVLIDSLRATLPESPAQPVLVAGDPETLAREERSRSGIPLSRSVVEDIRAIARASGVPFLLEGDA